MKKFWSWIAVFAVIFFAVGLIVLFLPGTGNWGFFCPVMPMMRGYFGAPYTAYNYGFLGGPMMMIGMFIVSLLFVALVAGGAVLLVKGLGEVKKPQGGLLCAHCSKPVQADWGYCPNCGQKPA
ncbi:MAG: zinc ribbon domain-containing protein [Anaerolineaceae bacterium]|nr:zinc ribbon domain-containing protein [Anaerolineaceae bacterium]